MRKAIAAFLSILVLVFIYSRIDLHEFGAHLKELNVFLFTLGLGFFIPQVGLTAYRWKILTAESCKLGFWECCRLVLLSSALNLILPSRLGDLGKGVILVQQKRLPFHRGVNLVVYEKLLDVGGLCAVLLIGSLMNSLWNAVTWTSNVLSGGFLVAMISLYLIPVERLHAGSLVWMEGKFFLTSFRHFILDSGELKREALKNPVKHGWIVVLTFILWWLHVGQVHAFFASLHSIAPSRAIYHLVPVAIFIGLVPVSFLGIGVRDSALIYLFAPYERASLMAGVGALTSLRYIVPGLLGLLFMNQYVLQKQFKAGESS